jgi:hypothetical protein
MTMRALLARYAALFALGAGLFVLGFFECCGGNYVASFAAYGAAVAAIFGALIRVTVVYRRNHPAPPGGYQPIANRWLIAGLFLVVGAIDVSSVFFRGARFELLMTASLAGASVSVFVVIRALQAMREGRRSS